MSAFFALLDDIAALADDVAAMSKVAMRKTAGVMGDDLALNAEQVTGVRPSRELYVVYEVAKGSLLNKAILIPLILLLSYFAPPVITVLLFIGGAYLCYEGVEAIIHKFFHKKAKKEEEKQHIERIKTLSKESLLVQENSKIRGAIKTDFILSGEILVISLSAMDAMNKGFLAKSLGLITIGLIVTVLVYGIVALIVKADDVGLWLETKKNSLAQQLGAAILWVMPKFLKLLSFVGVVAMLLVGGAIVHHSLPFMHSIQDWITIRGGWQAFVAQLGYDFTVGISMGTVVVGMMGGARRMGLVEIIQRIKSKK